MANRRRRPRVVWLPPDRQNRIIPASLASQTTDSGGYAFNVSVSSAAIGDQNTIIIPVVGDSPSSPATTGALLESLSDLENSGYRLRRLVGKVNVGIVPEAIFPDINNLAVVVTIAYIILRCDDLGEPLLGGNNVNYADDSFGGWADPWIWRRSWCLGNPDATARVWPLANWQYGSAFDGPHIDQKTARIVSNEERLFQVISLRNVVPTGNQQLNWSVDINGELRVLASMRTSSGNRRNASR